MKYSESKSFLAINRHISKKALPDRNDPAGLDSFLGLDLHPAGQGEGDPVLGVDHHAVNQRGPLTCVEFGVELRQGLDGFDEPLQLPAPDHDLTDLLDSLTQKNRMRMHTVMHSHPIFCPNLSTKGPNQVFFQSCLMNTWLRGGCFFPEWRDSNQNRNCRWQFHRPVRTSGRYLYRVFPSRAREKPMHANLSISAKKTVAPEGRV